MTTFGQHGHSITSDSIAAAIDTPLPSSGPTYILADKLPVSTLTDSRLQSRPEAILDSEHVVNLYYSNFHPAHPILLPRHMYGQNYPSYLRLVVQFIGSHYSASQSGDHLRIQTATALKDSSERTAFMVQARLLFAIAVHARGEPNEGLAMLQDAIELAISLGMNTKSFSSSNGGSISCLEESFRRTWWELFVVEGIMSAIHRRSTMKTTTAVQILSRVLSIANAEAHPDEVQAIDNSLAAWTHYVPPEKRDLISNSGEVDELLFQAHMVIHWATILLHMPRSELLS
ncbi:unnamed protein product [Aureobasidium pullulans]|nr:unnamed protein product [Aureobasidium pullulans]